MKPINIFRLLIITLITVNFITSYKLESMAEVVIMLFNIMFTSAWIIAEIAVFGRDEAQSKS